MTKPPASGPVVEALHTMRAADPAFDLTPDLRALRRALADRIEADLAALDALDGDADFEPSLGAGDDREEDAGDLPEEENEHGGDIQDEPHDMEPDGEPSLCGLTVAGASFHNPRVFLDGEEDAGAEPEEDHEREDDRSREHFPPDIIDGVLILPARRRRA